MLATIPEVVVVVIIVVVVSSSVPISTRQDFPLLVTSGLVIAQTGELGFPTGIFPPTIPGWWKLANIQITN